MTDIPTPEQAAHAIHLRLIKKGWPGMIASVVHEPATLPEYTDEELAELAKPIAQKVFDEFRAKSAFAKYMKD